MRRCAANPCQGWVFLYTGVRGPTRRLLTDDVVLYEKRQKLVQTVLFIMGTVTGALFLKIVTRVCAPVFVSVYSRTGAGPLPCCHETITTAGHALDLQRRALGPLAGVHQSGNYRRLRQIHTPARIRAMRGGRPGHAHNVGKVSRDAACGRSFTARGASVAGKVRFTLSGTTT